mgnify:CR=1 FL=1
MGTYVRYIQQQGARVVPILYSESDEITLEKLKGLNGVLFPGGAGDYLHKGKFVLDQVKKFNDDGQLYPLWGTCLGYENLVVFTADIGSEAL